MRINRQAGDTIVEVLVCITVVSLALVGAFVATNKSTSLNRQGQERAEATKYVEAQIEQLKQAAASEIAGLYGTDVFCLNSSLAPVTFSGTSTMPALESDNLAAQSTGIYPAACQVGSGVKYSLSIDKISGSTFQIRARWAGTGNLRSNEVLVSYRVYQP